MAETRHIWFFTQSFDFLIVYKLVSDKFPRLQEKTNIKYFLLFRSLELLLKSFLIYKGVEEKRVKGKFGHNLESLLLESNKFGLDKICPTEKEFKSVVLHMNSYYNDKQFEYPKLGFKRFVEPNYIEENLNIAINTLDKIYRKIP